MWVRADMIYHSKATDLGIGPVLLKGRLLPRVGKSLHFPERGDRTDFKTWILSNDTQVP